MYYVVGSIADKVEILDTSDDIIECYEKGYCIDNICNKIYLRGYNTKQSVFNYKIPCVPKHDSIASKSGVSIVLREMIVEPDGTIRLCGTCYISDNANSIAYFDNLYNKQILRLRNEDYKNFGTLAFSDNLGNIKYIDCEIDAEILGTIDDIVILWGRVIRMVYLSNDLSPIIFWYDIEYSTALYDLPISFSTEVLGKTIWLWFKIVYELGYIFCL